MADRTVKLVIFDGNTPSLAEWLTQVDMCRVAANWTDAQTAERVKLHLGGKAMAWLQNRLHDQTPGVDAWYPDLIAGARPPNLRTLLSERFIHTSTPSEQALLRASLSQLENEDVATFYDRCESVQFELDKSFPDALKGAKAMYDIVHAQLVLTNFICGLRTDIRLHVNSLGVPDLQAARNAAIAFEKASTKQGRVHGFQGQWSNEDRSVWQRLGDPPHRGRGQSRGRSSQNRGGASSGPNGCEYCGFLGHEISICNIKKKDVNNGVHRSRSEFYAPGRVGQRGRGRGQGRGRGRGTRQVGEMSGQEQDPGNPGSEEPAAGQDHMGAFRFYPEN